MMRRSFDFSSGLPASLMLSTFMSPEITSPIALAIFSVFPYTESYMIKVFNVFLNIVYVSDKPYDYLIARLFDRRSTL